ncbi:hypothetical protein BDP27DRAFT_1412642 [Rhodocollybia butyracea]|uniref:DUF4402 domain-containing protein n=1 Tax=Rhodocollybia butyracea TaxID=206335 RepID=A0A9P5UGR2_9AGAR|nr:hypothetical protein BDP27DRAFT_1412642 [Rhodocollybia butyracea]
MRFFTSLISLLAIATTSVVAQSARIGAPPDLTQVAAGSSFTVMIERPDTLTPSTEMALAIGLTSCTVCLGPSQELGTILYGGEFDPAFTTEPGTNTLPPHQNFTLTVPADFTQGPAQLGVAHFALVGASGGPLFQTFNITLIIT